MRLATSVLSAVVLSGSLLACTTAEESALPDDLEFIDDSKADDFISMSAVEWQLKGASTVVLDASWASKTSAQRLAEAKKLIGYKQIAIAWFITQYMVDKEDDAANASFGGFGGMAKAGAYEDLEIRERADKLTFDFKFKQLAAGGKNLTSKLPIRVSGGKQVFDLEVGKPSNTELAQLETNNEWYRRAPWTDWNPANVQAAQKEKITFEISREKESSDGYFDIERLTADGKLDIDIYFGWDYHAEYHLVHSKALFTWLKQKGFRAPVTSWDKLTHTTAPFTKTVEANGRDVKVEVRMFFGKPGTATDPDTDAGGILLENLAVDSLKTKDVIAYSGHSGPFYGFALANWKKTAEGDLDDADIRVAQMPRDRYQVVLAEGCDTYQIGTAFKENPNKAGKNVDTITTTSFSNAASPKVVQNFLDALTRTTTSGELEPQPVSNLLTALDSGTWGFTTMYGMHGIDDNPKLVPFADPAGFGESCSRHSDCGGPGNLCVASGSGARKACTAVCAADPGCGTGYTCKNVASPSTGTRYAKACAKAQ